MKAEELMIGDWLFYKGQVAAFPFKVEQITKKKVGYHAEPCENRMHYLILSECDPIPLTPEILEKNGFEKFPFHHIKNQHVWSFHQDMRIFVDLSTRKLNDNPVNGWSISISSTCTSEMIHKIDYVHELQHALKFSKIDKKIEL